MNHPGSLNHAYLALCLGLASQDLDGHTPPPPPPFVNPPETSDTQQASEVGLDLRRIVHIEIDRIKGAQGCRRKKAGLRSLPWSHPPGKKAGLRSFRHCSGTAGTGVRPGGSFALNPPEKEGRV